VGPGRRTPPPPPPPHGRSPAGPSRDGSTGHPAISGRWPRRRLGIGVPALRSWKASIESQVLPSFV
jgi:hypothetical protein